MSYKSLLPEMHLENQRVIIRADLNVPLNGSHILDDYRLASLLPTLNLLLEKKGKIVLMSHIGRPKNNAPQLSTQILVPWFKRRGYEVEFAATPEIAYEKSLEKNNSIILLENLRFFPGEKLQDPQFAQSLARLGEYYVNDAFATMHRTDSSIYITPTYFPKEKRTFGLLVEKELKMLNKLMSRPKEGFILILGGGKVVDKLPLISHMLDKADTILLCPAIVFSFAAAMGKEVGKSLIDEQAFEMCRATIAQAHEHSVELIMPSDYQVAQDSLQGPLQIVEAQHFGTQNFGISIGPKTIEEYCAIIKSANTIFFNAAMGFPSRQATMVGTYEILNAIAQSSAFSIIGGGDSVSAAQTIKIESKVDYLSTGGGATLTYLSGQKLPGLTILAK
jgi:phosphoglycerate kinase